jgi:Sigma-70 region 2
VVGALADDELVAAIEQVYRDGYWKFLRVAVAMLGDRERGRDAVQEGFARILRSRRDLRRVESLEGWIWRTVVNVCRVELRHKVVRLGDGYEPSQHGLPRTGQRFGRRSPRSRSGNGSCSFCATTQTWTIRGSPRLSGASAAPSPRPSTPLTGKSERRS